MQVRCLAQNPTRRGEATPFLLALLTAIWKGLSGSPRPMPRPPNAQDGGAGTQEGSVTTCESMNSGLWNLHGDSRLQLAPDHNDWSRAVGIPRH